MPGCAIAGIIAAVAVVVGVFLVAMLAAIALPAYQEYVIRSQVAEALNQARAHQADVDIQRGQSGACPDNAAIGLAEDETLILGGESSDTPAQASVLVGEVEGGHCAIELQFANVNPQVDGKTLLLESTDTGWTCTGGTLGAQYRTGQCREVPTAP